MPVSFLEISFGRVSAWLKPHLQNSTSKMIVAFLFQFGIPHLFGKNQGKLRKLLASLSEKSACTQKLYFLSKTRCRFILTNNKQGG